MRLDALIHSHLLANQTSTVTTAAASAATPLHGTIRLKQVQSWIRQGKFSVDNNQSTDPKVQVLKGVESVADQTGQALRVERGAWFLMNKPPGCVTAASDKSLPTIFDHVPLPLQATGLMNVGRLDKDTTGAMLFTDDGGIASLLLFPTSNVEKSYLVTHDKPLSEGAVDTVASGMLLCDPDGDNGDSNGDNTVQLLPADLTIISPTTCRLVLHEGLFHQVKRMIAKLGATVTSLHRESFGGFACDGLKEGEMRSLTEEEVEAIVDLLPSDRRGKRELEGDLKKRREGNKRRK
jgi:16S rRNA pseudouridine516 synthase